jgi:predicted ATP-binding protein involved in virulence
MLAMKLKTVILDNFRAVKCLELPLHPQLTVLVGENGAGKTTVLEGIVIGLQAIAARYPRVSSRGFKVSDLRGTWRKPYSQNVLPGFADSDNEFARVLKEPYMRVTLETTEGLRWDRNQQRDKAASTVAQIPARIGLRALWATVDGIIEKVQAGQPVLLPVCIYYGVDRTAPEVPQRQRNFRREFNRFLALESALEAGFRLKEVIEWFMVQEDLERREKEERRDWNYRLPVLQAVRQAIKSLLPYCGRVRTAIHPPRLIMGFEPMPGVYEELDFEQLSGGYRTMLALVMDLTRRIAQANPHLGERTAEIAGVVLIDEIDLHLHPRWQQRVLVDLLRAFPNMQFIVTTHSPQVLTTVHPENIVILRRENDSIVAEQAVSSYGAEAHRVLSEILGVDPRPPADYNEFTRLLQEYRSLIEHDSGETAKAMELRRSLQALSADDPALLRSDLEIRRRRALRQKEQAW